jgi:hypothetical protein
LRQVDARTGEVLQMLEMPHGSGVSGLESDGGDQFFCGGGSSGKVRTVRRPGGGPAAGSGSEIPVDSRNSQSKRPPPARFAGTLRDEPRLYSSDLRARSGRLLVIETDTRGNKTASRLSSER